MFYILVIDEHGVASKINEVKLPQKTDEKNSTVDFAQVNKWSIFNRN